MPAPGSCPARGCSLSSAVRRMVLIISRGYQATRSGSRVGDEGVFSMFQRLRTRAAVGAGVVALALTSCAGTSSGDSGTAGDTVSVVATTTILGDVVGQVVACGGGQARTLMPVGADPHDFAPSSADVAGMVTADLVVANGLGLEEGLTSALVTALEDGAAVLEVGPALDPQPFGSSSGSEDPHVWMDVARMAMAASVVGDKLVEVTGEVAYADCGAQVAAALTTTDGQVRDILADVPAGSRVLVTDHDALGYFARAYDFTVAGAVIPGGSTLAQPSSAELSELAQTVTATGARAIFANVANPTALVDALAQEVGQEVEVVDLYVGSVGPAGSGADTYAAMMGTNAHLIADGLTGRG